MGTTDRSKSKKKNTGVAVSVALLIIILLAAAYAYRTQKILQTLRNQEQSSTFAPEESSRPTPTPTPTKLFHGKDTYRVSGGSTTDINIAEVAIDPLDPAVGATQTFTVNIPNKYPVTQAALAIRTDTKTTKLPLARVAGTADNGSWQVSWTVPESYTYNYIVGVTAQSAYNKGMVTITIRERK